MLYPVGGGGVLWSGAELFEDLIIVREAVDEVDDGADIGKEVQLLLDRERAVEEQQERERSIRRG